MSRRSPTGWSNPCSQLTSFAEDMARRGMAVRSSWLDRGIYVAVARRDRGSWSFGDEKVARIARLRLSGDMPLAIERASLSVRLLPDPDAIGTSLYEHLDKHGGRPVRAIQRIRAVSLGDADARLLGSRAGAASLHIERTSYLASGRVVEFTRSIYRGDTYDFVAELRLGEREALMSGQTHMRMEVEEIPDATRRLLKDSADQLKAVGAALKTKQPAMVATIARGSSDHASAFLKYAIELVAGIPVASIGPSIVSIYGRELDSSTAARRSRFRSRARAPTASPWSSRRGATARCASRLYQHTGLAAGAVGGPRRRSARRGRDIGGRDQDIRRAPSWPG